MSLHTLLILKLRSAVKSEQQIGSPCKKACVSVAASQSLKGAQNIRSPRCLSLRHQLQVGMKGLLNRGTVRGQQPVVKPNGSSKPIELQRFVRTLMKYNPVRRRPLHT